jgi:hypothetical protein
MITIFGMSVVMNPATAVVDNMGHHNERHCYRQKPQLVLVPDLFEQQKNDAGQENKKRHQAMMMFAVSMPHGPGSDGKGQEDHEVFKCLIINDIYPENGQAGHQQRQYCTVNSAGQRSTYSQSIPVDSDIHGAKIGQNTQNMQLSCKYFVKNCQPARWQPKGSNFVLRIFPNEQKT